MAKERERSQKQHEKHQVILADMLREEDNKYCADCQAKGPRWASWNIGVFICIRCAGIHRNLGVHISKVKSVNLDSWTEEQIECIRTKGNRYGKEKYEATLPSTHKKPLDDHAAEMFIRSKYERKVYMSKEPVKQRTNASSESKQVSSPAKNKSKQSTTANASSNSTSLKANGGIARARKSPQPPNVVSSNPVTPSKSVPITSKSQGHTLSPSKPTVTAHSPSVDLLTDQPLSAQTSDPSPDLIGGMKPVNEQQRDMKNSILSLYNNTQSQGYTPQGYQVNSMYQQQQQAAQMYQQQQLQYQQWQQNQVSDVQRQMAQLKFGQQQKQQGGGAPTTLNPQLW